MSVYEKLLKVQRKLNAPKSKYNKFGQYYYRSCEDILEGVKPLLEKEKATLFISDEIVQIDNRFYVKATVRFVDIEDGTHIEVTAYARESDGVKGMSDGQVTGATSTYARKYALNGLFCIDDTKDSDDEELKNEAENRVKAAKENEKKAAKNTAQRTDEQKNQEMINSVDKDLIPTGNTVINAEKVEKLKAELKRTGNQESTILGFYKIQKIEEMTEAQFIACMNQLSKKETKA